MRPFSSGPPNTHFPDPQMRPQTARFLVNLTREARVILPTFAVTARFLVN
jgi:hypothetical protein